MSLSSIWPWMGSEAVIMTANNLLRPQVVALLPHDPQPAPALLNSVLPAYPDSVVIALASNADESAQFRRAWDGRDEIPLLIVRVKEGHEKEEALHAIRTVSNQKAPRPMAVLIGGQIRRANRGKEASWLEQLALQLCSEFIDIQVLEYSPSWSQSPPRIR